MKPIAGDEAKVRIHELAPLGAVPYDVVFLGDGPISGPYCYEPQDIISSAYKRVTPREGAPPPGSLVMVQPPNEGAAHLYGLDAAFGTNTSYYLGPFATPPLVDQRGSAVQPGHTYFNTSDNQTYVRTNANTWKRFGEPVPAASRRYVFSIVTTTYRLPATDDYGATLTYDPAQPTTVALIVNGSRQIGGSDFTLSTVSGVPGISLQVPAVAGDVVEVEVRVLPTPIFDSHPVAISTSGWVFDGATLTFPLVDANGAAVLPSSARGLQVHVLVDPVLGAGGSAVADSPDERWRSLAPDIEFTIAGSSITFTAPPLVASRVVVTVYRRDVQQRGALVATTGFTLSTAHAGMLITATTALTVNVPAATVLGAGFYCDLVGDGVVLSIDGPTTAASSPAAGTVIRVFTSNGKVRKTEVASSVI